jgi:hypothetical protein
VAMEKLAELKTLESNLTYVRGTYKKMILENAKRGRPIERLVDRLKAVEIQLWMVKEGRKEDRKKDRKNGQKD